MHTDYTYIEARRKGVGAWGNMNWLRVRNIKCEDSQEENEVEEE